MPPLHIIAIEQPSRHDNFSAAVAENLKGSRRFKVIRPQTVITMVRSVLALLRKNRGEKIGQLDLVGHGSAGHISVGAGTAVQPGQYIDMDPTTWRRLGRLRGRFAEGPNVGLRLLGCNTAHAGTEPLQSSGPLLQQQLARTLNVSVSAVNGIILPNHFNAEDGFTATDQLTTVYPPQVARRGISTLSPFAPATFTPVSSTEQFWWLDPAQVIQIDLTLPTETRRVNFFGRRRINNKAHVKRFVDQLDGAGIVSGTLPARTELTAEIERRGSKETITARFVLNRRYVAVTPSPGGDELVVPWMGDDLMTLWTQPR